MNLTTIDGMTELETLFGERLRQDFNENGRALPVFALVITVHPERGPLEEPAYVIVMAPDMSGGATFDEFERRRQIMSQWLRGMILKTKSIGVISGMEAWRSTAPKKFRDFSKDPNREEILVMVSEHVRFPARMRASRIDRVAAGKGVAGPWELYDTIKVEGRFATLLDRSRFA